MYSLSVVFLAEELSVLDVALRVGRHVGVADVAPHALLMPHVLRNAQHVSVADDVTAAETARSVDR